MSTLPSSKRNSFSKEWLIALSVFVVFCGMCAFLGVFRDKLSRGSASFSPSSSSSSSSSRTAATAAPKVYTAAPKKTAAATKEKAPPAPQVKITSARLVPFVSAPGKQGQMVMVDWENTGEMAIVAVYARIDLYDANGQLIPEASLASQRIFTASGSQGAGQRIEPGASYQTPTGAGIVVPPRTGSPAHRVAVEIIRLETP